MPTVACVLKSGGVYTPEYVHRLQDGVRRHLPGVRFRCFSDVKETATDPLRHDWPGWWSKMELFRPDVKGDLLYLDLDTVINGSLKDIAAVSDLTLLRDFGRPDGLGSGMMFLPEQDRSPIWLKWIEAPARWMRECSHGAMWGDQGFLEQFWKIKADRWQDLVPGQVVSHKWHSIDERKRARVICYHGSPKPHETGWAI
ncbi:glycosyltransferase family protein [Rhodobium gokarnense]|uniref:Glycosyltransferase n=1 Tax=Rhodobium gokarnense TaxID=364296 RepID=A0ABT3HH67_9HYPH|nr:hypothetical protein [Rhodobium gokarnense]MCW2309728.1 hypothetical protein [Rhodobium gokarnense]